MLRMLGAVLVLSGAGSFGIAKTMQYYRQVRQLRDFIGAVEIIKCELNYTMLPLPKLFRVTSQRIDGVCGRFFANLAENLEKGTPRKRAAENAIADTRGLSLPNDALMAILELCATLGRYDLHGENRVLQLSGQRLKSALERTELQKQPLAKSYVALGFCLGVALVILML